MDVYHKKHYNKYSIHITHNQGKDGVPKTRKAAVMVGNNHLGWVGRNLSG